MHWQCRHFGCRHPPAGRALQIDVVHPNTCTTSLSGISEPLSADYAMYGLGPARCSGGGMVVVAWWWWHGGGRLAP